MTSHENKDRKSWNPGAYFKFRRRRGGGGALIGGGGGLKFPKS